jgi:hypothetical protein
VRENAHALDRVRRDTLAGGCAKMRRIGVLPAGGVCTEAAPAGGAVAADTTRRTWALEVFVILRPRFRYK